AKKKPGAGRARDRRKTSWRRRNPHGVTKWCDRIAELGPRANDRQAAVGVFFRTADWVFDREWPRARSVVGEFPRAIEAAASSRPKPALLHGHRDVLRRLQNRIVRDGTQLIRARFGEF